MWSALALVPLMGADLARADLVLRKINLYPESPWQKRIQPQGLLVPYKPTRHGLNQHLFDPEVTSQIMERYEEKFGPMELSLMSQDLSGIEYWGPDYSEADIRVALVEENEDLDQYGNFVVNRLLEYHADSYLRSHERVKTVYEVKQALTTAKVEPIPGYKVSARYQLAGNFVKFNFDNPYADLHFTWEISGDSQLSLKRRWKKVWKAECRYRLEEGRVSGVLSNRYSESLNIRIQSSGYLHKEAEVDNEYETLTSLGFSWNI